MRDLRSTSLCGLTCAPFKRCVVGLSKSWGQPHRLNCTRQWRQRRNCRQRSCTQQRLQSAACLERALQLGVHRRGGAARRRRAAELGEILFLDCRDRRLVRLLVDGDRREDTQVVRVHVGVGELAGGGEKVLSVGLAGREGTARHSDTEPQRRKAQRGCVCEERQACM